MPKWTRQLGTSVVLVVLAASAWSQTPHYTVPAASLGDDFSVYRQALDSAADSALANVMRRASASSQVAEVAAKPIAPPDATALHRFAEQYWNGNDEAVRRAVARVTHLRPILTPILREQGIPDEVAALVLVESAGQLTALSPKGARGIWQFMPDTARRYGLTVNGETDDRLDAQKSTRAAARYLRELDAQFGDWSLALAAYNVGETFVQNALLRSGSKDFALLSHMRLIPAETRAYVSAVMAAARLFAPYDLLGDSSTHIRRSEVILNARSTTEVQQ
jgi:soluble lytic murein transglycosylase-like protein